MKTQQCWWWYSPTTQPLLRRGWVVGEYNHHVVRGAKFHRDEHSTSSAFSQPTTPPETIVFIEFSKSCSKYLFPVFSQSNSIFYLPFWFQPIRIHFLFTQLFTHVQGFNAFSGLRLLSYGFLRYVCFWGTFFTFWVTSGFLCIAKSMSYP